MIYLLSVILFISMAHLIMYLFPVAEVVSQEYEGQRDSKPHAQQRQHGGKWQLQGKARDIANILSYTVHLCVGLLKSYIYM